MDLKTLKIVTQPFLLVVQSFWYLSLQSVGTFEPENPLGRHIWVLCRSAVDVQRYQKEGLGGLKPWIYIFMRYKWH